MSQVLEMPTGKAPKEKKNTSTKGKMFIFTLLILGALALIALGVILFQGRLVSTQNTVTPDSIAVISPISAPFTEVLVTHGSEVQKGAIIARLDLSDYRAQLPHANVLVRGAVPNAQQTEKLVHEAQSAEADMVNRVALARQEENAKHALMEKLSVAHAKALLHLRSLSTTSKNYATAQQAERDVRDQLNNAKGAHEYASRSRMAVEGVLYSLRAQRLARGHGIPAVSPAIPIEEIADHLVAPVDGYIIGTVPAQGQVVQKDTPAFTLLPSKGTLLKAASHVTRQEANALRTSTPVFLVADGALLHGNITQILHDGDVSVIALEINAEGKDFEAIMGAVQSGKGKVVFWPNSWLQEHVPPAFLALLSYI